MVDEYDKEKSSSDATKHLEKQIKEYELLINHYKKMQPETMELKMCNNTFVQIDEVNIKSVDFFFGLDFFLLLIFLYYYFY